jgi:hypothetical protein
MPNVNHKKQLSDKVMNLIITKYESVNSIKNISKEIKL